MFKEFAWKSLRCRTFGCYHKIWIDTVFSVCSLNLKSFQRRGSELRWAQRNSILGGLLKTHLINSDRNSANAIFTLAFGCTVALHQHTPVGLHQCKLIWIEAGLELAWCDVQVSWGPVPENRLLLSSSLTGIVSVNLRVSCRHWKTHSSVSLQKENATDCWLLAPVKDHAVKRG